jgi:alpha-ketoglutarate-dependent taurine dioxygenase
MQCQKRIEVLKKTPSKLNWPIVTKAENGLFCMDLPDGLLDSISQAAKTLKTTSFVIQLNAFAEVLCQYLAIPEIIIGTAALTRRHPELEKLVACLTNLVPIKIQRAESLGKSCIKNHGEVYQALECAEVPFAKIVDTLQVERDPNRNPLVQVAFGIEAPAQPAVNGSIRGKGEEIYLGHTRLDLTVWVQSSGDKSLVVWNWRGSCLNEEIVKKLYNNWVSSLEKGIADPQTNWIMKRQFKKDYNDKTPRRPISEKLFDSFDGEDGVTRVYKATSAGSSITNFVNKEKTSLLEHFREYGALLLRGFQLGNSSELADVVKSMFTEEVNYSERSSPRSDVSKGVYTSTDHPNDQPIVLHNEQSYTLNWPLRILFRCDLPAKEGGATPIADMRKVIAELKPETVQKFSELGVLYQRNYLQGIGVPWQIAFQTTDREVAEKYCIDNNIDYEWISDNHLQTRQLRPAVRIHPESKEPLFFNHALFFHVTSLPSEISAGLKRALPPNHYPTQTFWGNGLDFEPEILDELRTVINRNTVRFDWQIGDVLILDNMKIAHGRDPFVGPRKVIVAMADPILTLYGEQTSIPAPILLESK